jgi:hypothetical protein
MRILCLCLCLLPAVRARADLKVSPDRVVAYEGERLDFKVIGAGLPRESDLGVGFHLVCYDGRDVPPGAFGPDNCSFMDLPRGYYELTVTDGSQTVVAPVVILPRPHPRPDSRLATDAAHSWLLPPARFDAGADLLQKAGFSWIRERLSWPEVEPERGVYRWGKYDASADAAVKRGINVYQVFHQTPGWARADHAWNRYPDDLRDVYNFCRAAAQHFKGRVRAWEVWNEADISAFSVDPGSEYAAFLKAAYLGFKAGDPKVQVTQVSLALASPEFHESLYRNGTPAYFDIFNYHIYANPKDYPARAQAHFALMDRFGVPKAPVWLTEAGIPLMAVKNTLTPEAKRRQAEFIPKSYAMSLACGTDRHFFFVFPHYLENGVEFGVMDAEMRPYPGYAALATVNDMLGAARFMGRVNLPGAPDAQALLFDNGRGETLAAWTEGASHRVELPDGAKVFDCVGDLLEQKEDGHPTAAVGTSPVYIRAPRGAFKAVPAGLPQRNPAKSAPRYLHEDVSPARYAGQQIVVRIRPAEDGILKGAKVCKFKASRSARIEVQVYNFGKQPRAGTVRLSAPQGWSLEPSSFDGDFLPMERRVFVATLTPPGRGTLATGELRGIVVPRSGASWGSGLPHLHEAVSPARQSAPAVLDVRLDPASLEPAEKTPLGLDKAYVHRVSP